MKQVDLSVADVFSAGHLKFDRLVKVNKSQTTFNFVIQALTLVIDVNSYFPQNPCYMAFRGNLRSQQAAIYRLSYLAKNKSKDTIPSHTKGYYFSRVNMNALNIITD